MISNKVHSKKNNELTLSWWILTIFVSFIISAGIIWLIHLIWHPTPTEIIEIIKNPQPLQPGLPTLPTLNRKEVILCMGVDSNGIGTDPFKGTRTDVMIVAALDPVRKTVNAISIPRDSKVYLADNKGIDKINAAHAYGGPDLAVKTVEQTLGIKIDHYIIIDYAGLKEVVKALGGVNVFVEKKMKYTDHTAKLFIDLKPGKQLLDADHAEMYLRFRHDAEADIGRIKRQQWFLRGVLEKMKEPAIILKIPALIGVAQKYTKTDMNPGQLMALAGFSKSIDFNKIQVATLPGRPNSSKRISYWLLDVNKSQELIDRLILGYDNNEDILEDTTPITLSIMYDKDNKESLDALLTEIDQTNYKVICKNTTTEPHTKIISHTNRATFKKTDTLRNSLSGFRKAPIFIAPQDIYCAASDYTIVLGKD